MFYLSIRAGRNQRPPNPNLAQRGNLLSSHSTYSRVQFRATPENCRQLQIAGSSQLAKLHSLTFQWRKINTEYSTCQAHSLVYYDFPDTELNTHSVLLQMVVGWRRGTWNCREFFKDFNDVLSKIQNKEQNKEETKQTKSKSQKGIHTKNIWEASLQLIAFSNSGEAHFPTTQDQLGSLYRN